MLRMTGRYRNHFLEHMRSVSAVVAVVVVLVALLVDVLFL